MREKFWRWVKDTATQKNVLRLDGVISDWRVDADDTLTTPKEFREELNLCKGDIELYINSPGGNVFSAAEIFAMLKEYRDGKITAKIPAFCASAASVIAMAADVIEISPLAFMCIHNPFADVIGTEKELSDGAKFLHDLKENLIGIYQQKTKLSREKISAMMDAETCMNSQKAIALHFADKLMFADENETLAQMYLGNRDVNLLFKIYRASNKAAKPITKDLRRRLIIGSDYSFIKEA